MRFSIVIPCRDEGQRLVACLDAIAAQDYPADRFEVIVVDGGSTDGSSGRAFGRGVTLLSEGGRGPAAARNRGVAAARGEIVAFTDADCVPRFDWLARLDEAFLADPEAGGVAGALRMPRESLLGRFEDNDARVHYRGFITSNIAYRREVLREVGGFDESLLCAEDYDLAWRVLDGGHRIERAPDAIVLHDPPEVSASVLRYLQKQAWYARHDLPAHARAVRRAWRSPRPMPGSQQAAAGLLDALANVALAGGVAAGLASRSALVAAVALSAPLVVASRAVARTAANAGDLPSDLPRIALVDAGKRLARGLGTLAGVADLARPSAWRVLRSAGPTPWPDASPRPLPAPPAA